MLLQYRCVALAVTLVQPRTSPCCMTLVDASLNDDAFVAERLAVLPPLGNSGPLLAGEASALASRRKQVRRKPDARVRLFALYGVADSSTSLRKWVSTSPMWLETRLLEVPGHGYRSEEALPPCAARRNDPVTADALARQRAVWVSGLADEMVPILRASPGSYAILGFSFGALLMYELCLELQHRGVPPPLVLIASGRGAPHAITFSTERMAAVQGYDDEAVLAYFATAFGVSTKRIAPSVRSRAAALFRCGALMGSVHVGESYDTKDASNLWDDITKPVEHAAGVPRVPCPVLGLAGSGDTCWPPHLVQRWADVSDDFKYTEVAVEHQALMNAPEAMLVAFAEVAQRAMQRAKKCTRSK